MKYRVRLDLSFANEADAKLLMNLVRRKVSSLYKLYYQLVSKSTTLDPD